MVMESLKIARKAFVESLYHIGDLWGHQCKGTSLTRTLLPRFEILGCFALGLCLPWFLSITDGVSQGYEDRPIPGDRKSSDSQLAWGFFSGLVEPFLDCMVVGEASTMSVSLPSAPPSPFTRRSEYKSEGSYSTRLAIGRTGACCGL